MDIEALIELANRALSPGSGASDVETASRIECYSQAFAEWYKSYDKSNSKDEMNSGLLQELSDKHRLVMDRARVVQESTSRDIRKLKLRGKGILAYTDMLPKRLSLGRKRRG